MKRVSPRVADDIIGQIKRSLKSPSSKSSDLVLYDDDIADQIKKGCRLAVVTDSSGRDKIVKKADERKFKLEVAEYTSQRNKYNEALVELDALRLNLILTDDAAQVMGMIASFKKKYL